MRAQELKIARNTKANMTNIVEQFSIPDGFADILKSFTREVLRDQPEDINAYAAEYFAALAAQQAPTSENEDLNIDMGGLRERIENMFVSADVEGKGYLNRTQFMEVMSTVQGELNMSDADLRHVMSEADENDDGMIDFNEFLPLALSIFEAIYAKQDLHKHEEEAVNKASDLLLHGMTRQELESMLHTLFNRADTEGKGYLDRQQFGKVLKDSDLGFTRREINTLMHQVDENEDGVIEFSEFVPLAFELCVGIMARSLATQDLPTGVKEAEEFFVALFSNADTDGSGHLKLNDIKHLIAQADLGLSRVQISALMSEAKRDPKDSKVDYRKFAPVAAQMVSSIINFQNAEDQAIQRERREQDQYALVHGRDAEGFYNDISASFAQIDQQGTGVLSIDQICDAIQGALAESSENDYNALLSLCMPADESGEMFYYQDILEYGFRVLQTANRDMNYSSYVN